MNTIHDNDTEYKLLINFLFNNLASQTIEYNHALRYSLSAAEVRSKDAIQNSWKKKESRLDDAGMFIATKMDLLRRLISEGLALDPETKVLFRNAAARTLYTAFSNWKIDAYKHKHTKKNTGIELVYLNPEQMTAVINKQETEMISRIEPEDNLAKWMALETSLNDFGKTLDKKEMVIWQYVKHGGEDKNKRAMLEAACDDLNMKERTFFTRVAEMKTRANVFYKEVLKEQEDV